MPGPERPRRRRRAVGGPLRPGERRRDLLEVVGYRRERLANRRSTVSESLRPEALELLEACARGPRAAPSGRRAARAPPRTPRARAGSPGRARSGASRRSTRAVSSSRSSPSAGSTSPAARSLRRASPDSASSRASSDLGSRRARARVLQLLPEADLRGAEARRLSPRPPVRSEPASTRAQGCVEAAGRLAGASTGCPRASRGRRRGAGERLHRRSPQAERRARARHPPPASARPPRRRRRPHARRRARDPPRARRARRRRASSSRSTASAVSPANQSLTAGGVVAVALASRMERPRRAATRTGRSGTRQRALRVAPREDGEAAEAVRPARSSSSTASPGASTSTADARARSAAATARSEPGSTSSARSQSRSLLGKGAPPAGAFPVREHPLERAQAPVLEPRVFGEPQSRSRAAVRVASAASLAARSSCAGSAPSASGGGIVPSSSRTRPRARTPTRYEERGARGRPGGDRAPRLPTRADPPRRRASSSARARSCEQAFET